MFHASKSFLMFASWKFLAMWKKIETIFFFFNDWAPQMLSSNSNITF